MQQHFFRKAAFRFICAMALIIPASAQSIKVQTASEHYDTAMSYVNSKDYIKALKEYDVAIAIDSNFVDAYYNRGNVKVTTKDFEGAIRDFSRAITLNPEFVNAYINRGFALLMHEKLPYALQDFNKAIALDSTRANAYVGRGQIFLRQNDLDRGCMDLTRAKKLGNNDVDKFLLKFCSASNSETSIDTTSVRQHATLRLDWPADEAWRVVNQEDGADLLMIELLKGNETFENWSEIGTMFVYKNVKASMAIPLETHMELLHKNAVKRCPSAKVTFLEKDEKAQFPWILFKIESNEQSRTESQVWYYVQTKNELFANFRGVKLGAVPPELEKKWIDFFKNSKVIVEQSR